jgi:hypothetical protein
VLAQGFVYVQLKVFPGVAQTVVGKHIDITLGFQAHRCIGNVLSLLAFGDVQRKGVRGAGIRGEAVHRIAKNIERLDPLVAGLEHQYSAVRGHGDQPWIRYQPRPNPLPG